MSDGGILGTWLTPESIRRKRAGAELEHTLGVVGPEAFVEALSQEQRDALLAADLGIPRDQLEYVGNAFYQKAADDVRRDAMRERVWQIEAEIVGRYPQEVTEEIQRARAGPQVLSAATHEQYAADQKHFAAWCKDLGVASMPCEPAVLSKYLLDECAPSVVGRRLAALADSHRRGGRILPRKHPLVKVAIRQAKSAGAQPPAAPSSGAGEEKPNG